MTATAQGALARLGVPVEALADFCCRHRVSQLALFGSVLRADFRPDSDVDVLVTLAPGSRWPLEEYLDVEEELTRLFGHKADVVERHIIERAENYIRREAILGSAEVAYAT